MNAGTDMSNTGPLEVGRRSRSRTTAAVSIILAGLALVVGSALSGAPAGATGIITVEQAPLPYDGDCVPTALARLNPSYFFATTESTPGAFKLIVTNTVDLCEPVAAVAAIYGMPDGGGQWPQRLLSTKDLTIGTASTTIITFTKDCQPAQFDVLTGETPPVIDVGGPYHGPLLFPTDVSTSEQYFAAGCEPTTTSTSSTSSTSSSTSTSSATTTQPSVLGITTIQAGPSTPAAAASARNASVAGISATAADPATRSLALTGAPSADMAILGGLLLLSGVAILAWTRRSPATA